MEDRLRWIEEQ